MTDNQSENNVSNSTTEKEKTSNPNFGEEETSNSAIGEEDNSNADADFELIDEQHWTPHLEDDLEWEELLVHTSAADDK